MPLNFRALRSLFLLAQAKNRWEPTRSSSLITPGMHAPLMRTLRDHIHMTSARRGGGGFMNCPILRTTSSDWLREMRTRERGVSKFFKILRASYVHGPLLDRRKEGRSLFCTWQERRFISHPTCWKWSFKFASTNVLVQATTWQKVSSSECVLKCYVCAETRT